VAGEQHTQLVDAAHDVVHEDALALLLQVVAPGELEHRTSTAESHG